MEKKEEDLVGEAARGGVSAFGELVRRHEASVRGYFRVRVRDWATADDLAQDVFLTAFKRMRSFRGDSSFATWLRGIAVNRLRNFIRKRRDEYVGGLDELERFMAGQADEAFGGADESRALEALRQCLARLESSSAALLRERYVVGRTVMELAERRDRGYSAMTMQLHRLRGAMAKCIEGKLAGGEA
jgi:RNA polymerase sigma-70 factor (ECF subfamily)